MKKYDLFLFDADGTLFDYDMAEVNALKTMFNYCGFEYSENARLKYREINSQIWKSYEKGEITKAELQTLRFTRLFREIGVCYDAEYFNQQPRPKGRGMLFSSGGYAQGFNTFFNRPEARTRERAEGIKPPRYE
jgi:phosphoglycolate phosphatase-like HAD superfamily hydrolase